MTNNPERSISRSLINTPSDLSDDSIARVVRTVNPLVADLIALWVKTKNYHWHMSGRNFRDYHLLLDEQSDEIIATVDPLAERVRKLGGKTITSIGQVSQLQRVKDNDDALDHPRAMLEDLMEENKLMAAHLREAHHICDEANDVGTASILEDYIDQTERRTWFLFEATRGVE